MAEVTAMRSNALPYPIYAQPFTIVFPLLDADGDLVSAASTPDCERSLNGDTFADCTNEMVEIATASGVYYLTLTASEMTADVVAVIAKSATSGMKTTVNTLYPRKLVTLRSGTAQAGAAGSITLDASASAVDDYYNGCVVAGVLDATNEVRIITDYVGSTKVASVTPNWVTTPDSDDTFIVYLPEGRQITQADTVAWNATAVATPATAGYPVVTHKVGTGTGEISLSSGTVTVWCDICERDHRYRDTGRCYYSGEDRQFGNRRQYLRDGGHHGRCHSGGRHRLERARRICGCRDCHRGQCRGAGRAQRRHLRGAGAGLASGHHHAAIQDRVPLQAGAEPHHPVGIRVRRIFRRCRNERSRGDSFRQRHGLRAGRAINRRLTADRAGSWRWTLETNVPRR